jgi:hypothetical protein
LVAIAGPRRIRLTALRAAPIHRQAALKQTERNSMQELRILLALMLLGSLPAFAQQQPATSASESTTSTDFFVMLGSDFVRPGLAPKANYNIGFGHTFGFLKKNPFGDELTFAYTYENGGSHGFLHTDFGSHTENVGIMKNFSILRTRRVTGYTWIMGGVTSLTGNPRVLNRFYNGEALGAIIHCNGHSSIWVQEMFNKVVTFLWYTTASIGYTLSW